MSKGHKGRRKPKANNTSANSAERNETLVKPVATAPSAATQGPNRKGKKPSRAPNKWNRTEAQKVPIDAKKMASLPGIERYGMLESRARLLRCGFDPHVTDLTPEQYEDHWLMWTLAEARRPTRKQFLGEAENLKRASRAPWVSWDWDTVARENKDDNADDGPATGVLGLGGFLQHPHAGPQMMEILFKDGRKTALKLARTSHSMWETVASNVNIWNFTTETMASNGYSRVFVVTNPNYTVGEVLRARMDHPYGIDDGPQHPDAWKLKALDLEEEIFTMTQRVYSIYEKMNQPAESAVATERFVAVESSLDEETIKAIGSLKPRSMDKMWKANQFVGMPHGQLFSPPLRFVATRLKQMLTTISAQRQAISVLHFHNTPLLDRRILAVILRACPNVVMVGVYSCPLIHFGDVICLLDLIHEINIARREEKKPEITAFDFFPHYNEGMPYEHPRAGVYGLTWGPRGQDAVQRGFFAILLKAFMKAKGMGLELLFDKGKAFMDYLHKVPFFPLSVPTFLDAMYRYLNIDDQTPNGDNEKRMAIYDLLKPVRLGLDYNMDRDWPSWYINTMGKHLIFCSCCGYEMFQDFFTAAGRDMRPHTRICAGCTFQVWLDEETDHLKLRKRKVLTELCPNWDRKAFNLDAPIIEKGKGLINLHITESVRPSPPTPYVDEDGTIRMHRFLEPLVRDNKLTEDSLQMLPTLSELTEGDNLNRLWGLTNKECNRVDAYSRIMRQVKIDVGDRRRPKPDPTKVNGEMVDHVDEVQPQRSLGTWTFTSKQAAELFLTGIRPKGW